MNDFASTVSAVLHEEAQEISMSVDMQQAEHKLRETMRSAKRQRRVRTFALAAVTLALLAGVVAYALNRPVAEGRPVEKITPTPSPALTSVPFALNATMMIPPLKAVLPAWAPYAEAQASGPGGYTYGQTICPANNGLCPGSPDRNIQLSTISHMYTLEGGKNFRPTYAQLVASWKAVASTGYGTVRDVSTTTVGGRPATTMTVTSLRQINALAGCGSATDARDSSNCYGIVPGLTLNLAIVDRGAGQPPTLMWESHYTSNTKDDQAVAQEFADWLGTVTFPHA